MVDALWLLIGLVLGAGSVWWLQRAELAALRKAREVAEDRLFYAWRDDKIVPAPRTVEAVASEPLAKELMEAINDFESLEGRAAMESRIRFLQERGMNTVGILRELEEPRY